MHDEDCARQVDGSRERSRWVEQKLKDVVQYEYTVSRPGKFEGEARYVPYFWDIYMEGDADSDDGDVVTFDVCDDDINIFGELKTVKVIGLVETEDGFVVEVSQMELKGEVGCP